VRIRTSLKNERKGKLVPSYNILLALLVAHALEEHHDLNATLNGNEIIYWKTINIGIAVDTPRGLLVPVLRNVSGKKIMELYEEAEDLLKRALAGKSLPEELKGGTFTITSLGTQEIDFFTPLINPPECAVLGVGRLNKEIIVDEYDNYIIRTMLPLSLTFDHRLIDGATAARFLKQVKKNIEEPFSFLFS
jgi:pyruvate dehydrogenase E2 component (dihydrolipoamide acetyltransferase)